ncbi:MAG: DUF167 family protein [Acidimicrobiia bacterium]|nr:DUF167 family protein [Acidimicrobiia bacterium]
METPDPVRAVGDGVEVRVLVVPNASRTEIVGLHGDRIKIRITAPPERGKANKAVCRFLRDAAGARGATVVAGAGHREKTIALTGVSPDTVRRSLTAES